MKVTLLQFVSVLVLASLLGGAASTLLVAQSRPADPQVVRARRFELLDGNGAIRAHLDTDPWTGIVNLSLFDGNRTPRVWLSASDVPALILWDAAGAPRVSISLKADGSPSLVMRESHDRNGQVLLSLAK